MPSGTPDYAAGWDPAELRRCCRCSRTMRHRQAKLDDHPGTVQHRGGGLCSTCQRSGQAAKPQRNERNEAARMAEALRIRDAIRARRARLGITPDGKKLPRRVSAG